MLFLEDTDAFEVLPEETMTGTVAFSSTALRVIGSGNPHNCYNRVEMLRGE